MRWSAVIQKIQNQQAHPPASDWDSVAFPAVDLKFTSTMSSCFDEESVSIPGSAAAILRNRGCKDFGNNQKPLESALYNGKKVQMEA